MSGEVEVLGAEAEGLVCEIVPILLRVKVVHVLVDKQTGVGGWIIVGS